MIYEFLTPVEKESILEEGQLHPGQLGNYIFIYQGAEVELNQFNMAFIGVQEDRGSVANVGSVKAPDLVRHQFYKLFMPPVEREFRFIDLGNIKAGDTPR